MRRLVLTSVLCLIALGSTAAAADEDTARAARFFQAGSEAYARRDFREAALQFENAYHTAPRGAALYNAGLAWEGAGDLARAADDLAAAIRDGSTAPDQRTEATSRLKALEARVGRLTVSGPADAHASVDDGPEAGVPLGVHLLPGHHTLSVVYASGARESLAIDAEAGAEHLIRLDERVAPAAIAKERERRPDAAAKPAPDRTTRRTAAWVSLAGTAVASGLAIVFYAQGLSALHQFENGGDTDRGLHDRAVNDRTLAQVFSGAAAALGVTACVLYFASSPPASQPAAAVRLGPTGAAVRVTF